MSAEPELSESDLAKARRIATELVKLHRAGAIRDVQDTEASFYANLIQSFQAEFIGKGEAHPQKRSHTTAP